MAEKVAEFGVLGPLQICVDGALTNAVRESTPMLPSSLRRLDT